MTAAAAAAALGWAALRALLLLLSRLLARCGGCAGTRLGRGGDRWLLRAFAVGEPHVVDRMLDRVQARTRGEHPAGEDALDLALQGDLVDLEEGVGVRRLGRRARVADARRHLQRAELHRLVQRNVERDDAAGDLVEAGEHRRIVRDLLRRRRDHDLVVRRRGRGRRLAGRAARLALPGGRPGSARLRGWPAPGGGGRSCCWNPPGGRPACCGG